MLNKKQLISQIYGYIICVIAVSVMLATATALVGAVIDQDKPAGARYGDDRLASFESFKLSTMRNRDQKAEPLKMDDDALRAAYKSEVDSRSAMERFETKKSIIVNAVTLVFTALLFAGHWLWLAKIRSLPE